MRAICVSDLHIAGPDCPRQQAFLRLLAAEAGRCDLLCLCGDVFEHWWHWPGTAPRPFPQYAEVVDALRGFQLVVLPGNHDWAAPAFFAEHLNAAIPDDSGVFPCIWEGERVVLAHGDQADLSRGYWLASTILRGAAFRHAMNALSAERAWRVFGRLSGNGAVRPNARLLAAQQAWAQQQAGDTVIFGHTHSPSITHVTVENTLKTLVNIGDGVSHYTYVEYDSTRPDRAQIVEFASPLHAIA
jgi:UDP-2,3-diacylglucosamine hydrolase